MALRVPGCPPKPRQNRQGGRTNATPRTKMGWRVPADHGGWAGAPGAIKIPQTYRRAIETAEEFGPAPMLRLGTGGWTQSAEGKVDEAEMAEGSGTSWSSTSRTRASRSGYVSCAQNLWELAASLPQTISPAASQVMPRQDKLDNAGSASLVALCALATSSRVGGRRSSNPKPIFPQECGAHALSRLRRRQEKQNVCRSGGDLKPAAKP